MESTKALGGIYPFEEFILNHFCPKVFIKRCRYSISPTGDGSGLEVPNDDDDSYDEKLVLVPKTTTKKEAKVLLQQYNIVHLSSLYIVYANFSVFCKTDLLL